MDRPPNPTVRRLLRKASTDDLLAVREVAWRDGLWKLCRAASVELRRRTTRDIDTRLKSYTATLKRP